MGGALVVSHHQGRLVQELVHSGLGTAPADRLQVGVAAGDAALPGRVHRCLPGCAGASVRGDGAGRPGSTSAVIRQRQLDPWCAREGRASQLVWPPGHLCCDM